MEDFSKDPFQRYSDRAHDTRIIMTLREYYAGLALQGLVGNSFKEMPTMDFLVKQSVMLADTLIEELEK
jgi:hypothetical protein